MDQLSGVYYSLAHLPRGMFVGPNKRPKRGGFVRSFSIFHLENRNEREREREREVVLKAMIIHGNGTLCE